MSLFTDEPRSATLVAIRDSGLVRLGKDRFKQLLSISTQVSIALTRQIIHRLKTEGSRSLPDKPVTIGVLPVCDAGHVHIRPQLARDRGRLARLVSRNGVGLVLAGDGARGLAHIGIEIDLVGGTGRTMAALSAAAQRAFASNPTSDFNGLPMIFWIRSRRPRRLMDDSITELTGHAAQIEDLWRNHFCVTTNCPQAREQVLGQGALPPVMLGGDLLCDGGTFNNLPADVMRGRWGKGRVIGVDLRHNKPRRFEFEEVPGNLALRRDSLRPRARRRYRLPALSALLMNVSVLHSTSRQRDGRKLIDLYFKPALAAHRHAAVEPVRRIGRARLPTCLRSAGRPSSKLGTSEIPL